MNAEEQLFEEYSYLIPITLHKMYDSPKNIAKSKHLEYDDLLQFGRYGLMNACRTWESKKLGTFRNFCIRNIKWEIGSHLVRQSINQSMYKNTNAKRRKDNVKLTVLSMNNKPTQDAGEDTSFNDIISSISRN
jgi:DNA-directed RNA polymerase specialized sigma subunit